ncbi:unnamed protein product, partial [Symbiodinium necroappetens]
VHLPLSERPEVMLNGASVTTSLPPSIGSDEDHEAQVWSPTFLLFVPDAMHEVVQVTLEAPCSVDTALQSIVDAASAERYRFFSRHVVVDPQPSQHWGAILALPAWTDDEPVAVLDLLHVDGRCFATYLPNPFNRTQALYAARLPVDYPVEVFAFGWHTPMQPRDRVDMVEGGKITFRRPGAMHVVQGRYGVVHEGGYGYFTTIDGSESDVLQGARAASGLTSGTVHYAVGQLEVQDVMCHGLPCQGICAVAPAEAAATSSGFHPCVVLIDQRPLLEGWSLWVSLTNELCHAELASLLETFVPAGWQIQILGANIEGGMLQVHNGLVLTAEFVPVTSPEETVHSPQLTEGLSEADSGTSPPSGSFGGGPSQPAPANGGTSAPDGRSVARDRSRSRTPPAPSSRVLRLRAGMGACLLGQPSCLSAVGAICALPVSSASALYADHTSPDIVSACGLYGALADILVQATRRNLCWLGLAPCLVLLHGIGTFCLLWIRSCKFLSEPQGRNCSERARLAVLRSLTVELGGQWMPRLPFFFDLPPDVEAEADDSDFPQEQVVRRIPCAILKLDYTPEHVAVALRVPATQEELTRALEVRRHAQVQCTFPALLPVLPQPVPGFAVFIASTAWHGFSGVCFDTSQIDHRVFLVFMPEYVTRSLLIRCADLPAGLDLAVRFGVDNIPLPDDVEVHLYPGALIQFIPTRTVLQELPGLPTLGQSLLLPDAWSPNAAFPAPAFDGAVGLLFRGSAHLFISEPGEATRYRQRIA